MAFGAFGADTPGQVVADFTATPTSGTNPLVVNFTDASTGSTPTTWLWNFGDGALAGPGPEQTHTYTLPGTYSVSLTVVSPSGTDNEVKTDLIVVDPAIFDVEFTVFPVIAHDSKPIAFNNVSSGAVESFLWDFGDGNTSTEHSPTHGYESPGEYEISLTASVGDEMKVGSHSVKTVPSFESAASIFTTPWSFRGNSVADIDGDGDTDLVLGISLGDMMWFENLDGAGTFGAAQDIDVTGIDMGMLWTADGDADGDTDVFVVDDTADTFGNDTSTLKMLTNADGLGGFGPAFSITDPGHVPVDLRFGDFDADGDLDLLSAQAEAKRIALHRQGTNGFFTNEALQSNLAGASSVDAGDIDGDGDLDAVGASRDADSISWFENLDGLASFGAPQGISLTADGVWSTRLGDLDGDGDLDLLSAGIDDDTLRWFENGDGAGSFLPGQVITAAYANPSRLVVSDLDADGDVDVALTLGLMTAWLENTDGMGTFGEPTRIANLSNFHVADLDGDDQPDLAMSMSDAQQELNWTRNIRAEWPWQDLGGASLGIAGAPALQAVGPLTEGSDITLTLEQAPGSALMLVRVSLTSTPVNVIGGTLHTIPYVQQLLVVADALGGFMVTAPMSPGVPAGLDFIFQFIIQDLSSPHGITLSNAMVGTTP